MKKVATVLIAFLSILAGHAQNSASLEGRVIDRDGQPVSFATIMLSSEKDSSLVKAQISELEGQFSINDLEADKYVLNITFVGYSDYTSGPIQLEGGEDLTIPDIVLLEKAEELEEVVVKATRPLVEVQPDKTVFNIEGSINAAGSDALELLRKAPGVVVDNNERIMLQGKNGVKVYINGKKSPLAADDLADYLKSLQSSEIEAFEIIVNPSAKYDAEGNAGIINIRIKKDKGLGTNGTLTSTFRQGITAKNSNSLSVNHRDKSINIFGNYGNNFGQWRNYNNILREQVGQAFDAHSDMVSDNRGHTFRLGTDFFLDDKHTFGFLIDGGLKEGDWHNQARTRIYPLATNITSGYLLAENYMNQDDDRLNANINYVYRNGNETSLNIDVDYGFFKSQDGSFQPNRYLDDTETILLDERIFTSYTPTDIDIYTLKADYQTKLGEGTISAGGKFSYVSTDNTFDFFDHVDGEEIRNEDRSNNFVYKENVNAGYTTYQLQKDKWNFMAGLRVEHTHSMGDLTSAQERNNQLVERDYVDVFPSGGITYSANENHAWRINYSRRIDRPSYQDLNPFEFKLDELTFQKGNAFLSPQYTNSYSVSHTYKSRLNSTLTYSITDDLMTQITDTFSADASFITYVNLAKQKNISLAVSYPFSVSKWWSVYTNATAYRVRNNADFGGAKIVDISANVFNLYGQNTFMLPRGLKLELSGFYNSPGIWGGNFKTRSMWAIDLGLQTKMFKERANLKLAISDIFKTQRWTGDNSFGALVIKTSGGWESRQFRATLTYNFGNEQVKKERSRATGLQDEQRRVK